MANQDESNTEVTIEQAEVEPSLTILQDFLAHQKRAMDEARLAVVGLIPVSLREHGQSAVEEVIEGYRTLFTSAIGGLNEKIQKLRVSIEKR